MGCELRDGRATAPESCGESFLKEGRKCQFLNKALKYGQDGMWVFGGCGAQGSLLAQEGHGRGEGTVVLM